MEMEKAEWEEEEEEEWARHGGRLESDQGGVVERWDQQKCRWGEVDGYEQDEREMAVEQEGRRVEVVMDGWTCFEVQNERTGWRMKRALQAEGKMLVELRQAGRKVQQTERREARELRGGSSQRRECCCCYFWEGCRERR